MLEYSRAVAPFRAAFRLREAPCVARVFTKARFSPRVLHPERDAKGFAALGGCAAEQTKQFPNYFPGTRGAVVYRCEATSIAGFVQQLAVGYVANGYWFYVTGIIPDGKDPGTVDEKIIGQYGIDVSKWTRCRRKRAGSANAQYLRYGRFFIIIATRGEHPLFAAERKRLRDAREHPIHFRGYSIGCRRGRGGGKYHPSVRIQREDYRQLKAHFAQIAVHRTAEDLRHELRAIPFEPYAPVRNQLRGILRLVNRLRKAAGLELLSWDTLRLRRRPVQPFGKPGSDRGLQEMPRLCAAEPPSGRLDAVLP